MKTFLAMIGFLIIGSLIAIPINMLVVHVIFDIADLWSIWFIQELSYGALFGIFTIIWFIRSYPTRKAVKRHLDDDQKDIDIEEEVALTLTQALLATLTTLIFWAMAYMTYAIVM